MSPNGAGSGGVQVAPVRTRTPPHDRMPVHLHFPAARVACRSLKVTSLCGVSGAAGGGGLEVAEIVRREPVLVSHGDQQGTVRKKPLEKSQLMLLQPDLHTIQLD